MLLEVANFATSVCKSSKHFGLSDAYDAPKIWNDLPDGVCSAISLHSFKKKLEIYLFAKAYPLYFCFYQSLSVGLTPATSQDNYYRFLLFLYGESSVCL